MMKELRIFAASPSDMATERAKVETIASMPSRWLRCRTCRISPMRRAG